MPKTKESIAAYNKEYFARPEVKERAKIRNAQYRKRRAEYKKTERGKEAEKRWRQSESAKEVKRRSTLKRRYGLTPEQLVDMFEAQNKECKICLKTIDKYHIDHDHDSGIVRGLLCGPCNMALGLLKDNTETLRSAIEYLEVNRVIH